MVHDGRKIVIFCTSQWMFPRCVLWRNFSCKWHRFLSVCVAQVRTFSESDAVSERRQFESSRNHFKRGFETCARAIFIALRIGTFELVVQFHAHD